MIIGVFDRARWNCWEIYYSKYVLLFYIKLFNELDLIYVEPICSFQVAGTSGKALLEGGSDDEGSSTEAHGRAIIEVLGRDKRNEVLAALYMVRTDVSLSVRQVMINTVTLLLFIHIAHYL